MNSAFGAENGWQQVIQGDMNPLLILSLLLIAGLLGGWLARRIGLPGLTGNILAGVLIGSGGLNLFSGWAVTEELRPLSTFAMGLIAMSVGSHLSYRRIHNALRRIIGIAVFEVLGAVVLVTAVLCYAGKHPLVAFTLGAISASTAPASTVALVRELRAKGSFTKTLMSVVALDNMLCIILFAFASAMLGDYYEGGGGSLWISRAILNTAWQFAGSAALGVGIGFVSTRFVWRFSVHDFTIVFIVVLVSVGSAEYFGLSALLTCLFFGAYMGNSREEKSLERMAALEPLELLLFTCFFTMAGAQLHLDVVLASGGVCAVYFLSRFAGKAMGGYAGGLFSRASARIRVNAALALVPQAGVAVGLIIVLSGDHRIPLNISEFVSTLVLGAVTVNEIIGPLFTRYAIRRSGESNKDRRRLIEFLQEEFILTDLEAPDKWEALKKLSEFYMLTHNIPSSDRSTLFETIVARERECGTAAGHNAAIPHGRVKHGSGIRGVLGISRNGVEFDAPDGQPVHLIMLVVTPEGFETAHLEVMASLAQLVSNENVRTRLINAIDANDAWEIIESEDARGYNYFLEDMGENGEPGSASTAA